MSYFAIIILALALSVDACVISFSYGIQYNLNRMKTSSALALTTGLFQGIMPIIGYILTEFVKNYIQPYGRIIACIIFCYLGIKFICESFENTDKDIKCPDFKCLMLIGIATSIDAFSAGITLSVLGNKILKPSVLIGLVTFINSYLGFILGTKCRKIPSQKLEILAGILLIILGLKSLF